MGWWQQFSLDVFEKVDIARVLINLALAILLGQVLAWHYVRFARVLSNKRRFARIFVFIATTTLLLITVVKSSLALSLGLVGALSIIRFRTPIKEPEELAYLFLAIAIGVGLGADRQAADTRVVTVVVFTVVLIYLAVRGQRDAVPLRTVLQVGVPLPEGDGKAELDGLLAAVREPCSRVELRRVDRHDGELQLSLVVELVSADRIGEVLERVSVRFPGASVSLIERDGLE